jgi:general secretion pathway protein I
VSLGAAYSNVLMSRLALKQDEQRLDDQARCRAALLETPGFDDVEAGGEIHLPGDRTARWQGKIEATSVSDLFAVQLTAEIEPPDGGEAEEFTETRMLLRPTWSIPADRQKIRDEVRQRLLQERGYKESDGNSAFISTPTRGKKLVPSNPGAKGAAARPPASTAPGGKSKGAPAPPSRAPAPAPAPAPRPAQ